MTNYTKTTDFAAKDSLPSGDSGKIIRGSEFETEFDNIATAVNSKSDANNPTFTGTVTIDGLTVNGNTTLGNAATDTVTVTADIASNLIPSADDTYNLGASGAEWNDLFIDGTANIDSLVAGSGSFTSISTSGDVNFGDNAKAIFGAGSDLQIYHDGSGSYINESGTGNLNINANRFVVGSGAPSYEYMMQAIPDGAVQLYHNNLQKLATTSTGVDVTGSVTADGLTVDGTVDVNLGSDGSNIASLSGASAGRKLDIQSFTVGASAGAGYSINATSGQGELDFQTAGNSRLNIDAFGDISFYEDTGTTAKLFWDASAESLGIGTSSVGATLEVAGPANTSTDVVHFSNSNGSQKGVFRLNSIGAGEFVLRDPGNAQDVVLSAQGASYFNGGNVGIGTSSPSSALEVSGTNAGAEVQGLRLTNSSTATSTSSSIIFNLSTVSADSAKIAAIRTNSPTSSDTELAFSQSRNGTLTERMRIDSDGNVGIGTTSPSAELHIADTTSNCVLRLESASTQQSNIFFDDTDAINRGQIRYNHSNDSLTFGTAGTERMRIDSDGNVLIGKTTVNSATTVGLELQSDGQIFSIVDGRTAGTFIRKTSDGSIVDFRKDSTTVGSIGTNNDSGSKLFIGNSDSAIKFKTNAIVPANSVGSNNNDDIDLGENGTAFKNLYLSGGAYLGGVAAANKLDDYEEGTWTATLSDAQTGGNDSPTTVTGYYTKVGRIVHARVFNLNNIDTTGMTGANDLYVSLPIAASGGLNVGSVIMHGIDLGSGFTQVQVRTQSSSSKALFVKTGSNEADNFVNVSAITSGSDDISAITITYEAT